VTGRNSFDNEGAQLIERVGIERRRELLDLQDEIALLREVAKCTNIMNERLVMTLRWQTISTGIVMIVFLGVALIAMWR